MTGRKEPMLTDDLIREALHLELEAVEPPPADKIWLRIEAGLPSKTSDARRRFTSFNRYAALAAAACLLLVLGGAGVFQIMQVASPGAEYGRAEDAVEEVVALDAENDSISGLEYIEDDAAGTVLPSFLDEADPSPPLWNISPAEDFVLGEAVLLKAGGRPYYHGAVYRGIEVELLWVKAKSDDQELKQFVKHLVLHLQAEPKTMEVVNGYVFFVAAEKAGLAWQQAGRNQALWILYGFIPDEELKSIATGTY